MNKEKSIDVLNTLIEINNYRVAGYETATNETKEADLKLLFSGLKQTSEKCNRELISEVVKLGGKSTEDNKKTGKLYRVWVDIKSTPTGKDRKTILSSCEFGEDMAVDTYQKALRDNLLDITAEQQAMLNEQFAQIKAGHNKVKNLRDDLVDVE